MKNDNMDAAALCAWMPQVLGTDTQLQRARKAEADRLARCKRCQEDLADRRITQDEHDSWLRGAGEPEWLAAQRETRRIAQAVFTTTVEPQILRFLQERTARRDAMLTEILAIDGELERVENTCAALKLPSRPSCRTDLTGTWLAHQRARALAALEPLAALRHEAPKAPAPRPNYEPVVAVVAARSSVT